MSFSKFQLHPKLASALVELGYETPTTIQQEAIPHALKERDLLASANTGTGKTAAFLLPALNRITTPAKGPGPRILVLVPTRELAMQVATQARKYSAHLRQIRTVAIYGGVAYPIQKRDLSRPYDVLVATPGRLIDHLNSGRIRLTNIELLILDEADRLLDMGFIDPVKTIAAATPSSRQTMMFSATLKGSVMKLSKQLLKNPCEIQTESQSFHEKMIEQRFHLADSLEHKFQLLNHILLDPTLNQAIIFTSTKHFADQLADQLSEEGHSVGALHGDMNQRQRTRMIGKFREKKIKILVATDVAARGIDISTISHVVNFDLPITTEDYTHRIGRTGRAGSTGLAYTLATHRDLPMLKRLEQSTGKPIIPIVIPGLEPKSKARAPKKFSRPRHPRSTFKRSRR